MLKVAILDDYQNVSHEFVDLKKLSGKYEFKIFSEPFEDEADAIEQLADFEALLMPHVGYVTVENYSVFYTQMIEGLEACVNGKPIRIIEK